MTYGFLFRQIWNLKFMISTYLGKEWTIFANFFEKKKIESHQA